MDNKDFMKLLKQACNETNSVEEMDEYMIEKLHDVFPYDLVFKKEMIK